MEFYFFHLMPWPHLPEDFDTNHPSAWVTFSNKHYDPERGHHLYHRYLDELEYGEELGFDGICVNEHHQNSYGTMPAPNIIAAALARLAWNPYLHNPKLLRRLGRIRVPTLVLWGAGDRLFPLEIGKAWERAIPGARLVVLEGCAHVPPLDDPEAFVRTATEFLTEAQR